MTTAGSREMRVAAFFLFLGAMGAMALPWPPEVGNVGAERLPSGSSSYARPRGDSFGYSFGGGSPVFDNDVGDGDDRSDYPPSRGSASARYPAARPGTRPIPDSNSDSILFPWASAGPSRYGTTRSPVTTRPATTRTATTARGRNTPTPATPRPAGTSRTPDSRGTGTARPSATSNSRRSQDCQRFRQLAREFADSNTLPFRIVGGSNASVGEFPYIAALGFTGGNGLQFLCGGSLISERYILTAAHCITDAKPRKLSVARLGELTLTGSSGPGDYAVQEMTLHPDHDARLRYNDVALLRLDRPVRFSAAVTPICLPDALPGPPAAETYVLVAGWGAVDASGYGMSSTLQKAGLQVVERSECQQLIGREPSLPRGLTGDMLCARDPTGRADTCSGDSGGPLVLRSTSGEDTLLGVTSFGGSPCGGLRPGVYAMTSAVISWIEEIVWP